MGQISDHWIFGTGPDQNYAGGKFDAGDRSGMATEIAAVALAYGRTAPGKTTACVVEADAAGELVYGAEVPVEFDVSPKPIRLASTWVVLGRLEIRMCRDQVELSRFRGWDMVLATWPYANGWCDALELRGPNPEANSSRKFRTLDREPQDWKKDQLPETDDLLELIDAYDRLGHDAFLTDDQYLVAGKFRFASFIPAAGKARSYRGLVAKQDPSWIVGLCPSYTEAFKTVRGSKGWAEVLAAARLPRSRNGRHWTKEERDYIDGNAVGVAELAVRLALAGFRRPDERERLERAGSPVRVVSYARVIARVVAEAWIRAVVRNNARDGLSFDEDLDSPDGGSGDDDAD